MTLILMVSLVLLLIYCLKSYDCGRNLRIPVYCSIETSCFLHNHISRLKSLLDIDMCTYTRSELLRMHNSQGVSNAVRTRVTSLRIAERSAALGCRRNHLGRTLTIKVRCRSLGTVCHSVHRKKVIVKEKRFRIRKNLL